jgi:hypothetical protein
MIRAGSISVGATGMAALLGRDWQRAEPKAAPPLPIFR